MKNKELINIIKQYPLGELKGRLEHFKYDEMVFLTGVGKKLGLTVDYRFNYLNGTCGLSNFKPILRPLSDLTKEIEHNGEKFVPAEFLEEYGYKDQLYYVNKYNFNSCTYRLIYLLLKWKFDVFELIPKGHAIDVNSINKKVY